MVLITGGVPGVHEVDRVTTPFLIPPAGRLVFLPAILPVVSIIQLHMPIADDRYGIPGRATEYLRDQLPRWLQAPVLSIDPTTMSISLIMHLEDIGPGDPKLSHLVEEVPVELPLLHLRHLIHIPALVLVDGKAKLSKLQRVLPRTVPNQSNILGKCSP